jgi:hypothetical protein
MNIDFEGGGSLSEPVPQVLDDLYLSNVSIAINITCAVLALEAWSTSDLGCSIFDFSTVVRYLSQPIELSWPGFRLGSPFGNVE